MEYLVICLIYFDDGMREFHIPAASYADAIAIMDAELYVSEHRANERGEICELETAGRSR